MFLASAVAHMALVVSRPHHVAPRVPASAIVVAPHALDVEGAPSASTMTTPVAPVVTAPMPVVAAPAEMPDFRVAVARHLESLPICRRSVGPRGPGFAEVTFFPSGNARIDLSPNYLDTSVGLCVTRRIGGAAQPFTGEPVKMKVRFEV